MAATGEVRAEAGVAWRAKKKEAGRATAAAGRRATRGVIRKQEVALGYRNGEQQRGVARADEGATWRKQGRLARGWETAAQSGGGRMARCRAARGRRGHCTWPVERWRRSAERNRGERAGGGRKGIVL
jgi:hypothetical protein